MSTSNSAALGRPPSRGSAIGTLGEIVRALGAWRIWGVTAVDDIMGRYRRTILGPLWITLGQAGFIAGLYLLRSKFSAGDTNYLAYLAASIPTWGLLASFIVDGSNSLIKSKGFIDNYPIPMAVFSMRAVAAAYINYAHLLVVYLVIVALMLKAPTIAHLAILPGLLITLVFGLGCVLMLGPLGARFRDLAPATNMGTSLMFVLTPVFWVPEPAQVDSALVTYNPFYYLLEVVRAPLLGQVVEPHVWLLAVAVAAAVFVAGLATYVRMRPQIVYWL
jgi:ABC-type polysaccharide/polyol phosphate export permease